MYDNKGLGVIRIKPLGAGGGGGEASSQTAHSTVTYTDSTVSINGKQFNYPKMVVTPDTNQETLFNEFMPNCVDGFMDGFNVNIIAYGQTGSGKTYTMFGPPGCMDRAANGEYKFNIHESYGLFPRGIIEIFKKLQNLKSAESSCSYVMTCSAVELAAFGNADMFDKSLDQAHCFKLGSSSCGVVLDKTTQPPRLYGQNEIIIDKQEDLLRVSIGEIFFV